MTRRVLLVGGSRGIGAAAAKHLASSCELFSVSRGPAVAGRWIAADVASDVGLDAVVAALAGQRLDALLYLGGTWEAGAFTAAYDFSASPRAETRHVLAVNLTAPVLLVQALAENLARAAAPRVVLMGSLSGKDGGASREVANTASKFGLRGAAQALRLALPQLAVTVINPGNIATPEVEADIAEDRFAPQQAIPMADLLSTLDFVLACSPQTVPSEIDLAQTRP
jgi:NAD(P)-dependent dehydrogenase (short-subunit alcohol dehydrogenase family)